MTTFNYLNAPAGAGKSFWASNRMIDHPARYLVVRDRIEAISDSEKTLRQMRGNRPIRIETITGENTKSVRAAIRSYPNWNQNEHIILLITHAAMKGSDLSGFGGWEIIIDETPAIFDQQNFITPLSHDVFAAHYDIAEIGQGWSSITANKLGKAITPAEIGRDDLLDDLRVFHERVLESTAGKRAVVANVADWGDLADGRAWSWWSLWSLHSLKVFSSVTIMANAFEKSLTFAAFRFLHPDIKWQDVKLAPRPYKTRAVHIEYFASSHVASSYLFMSDNGKENLGKIAQHCSDRRDQIWTTNDKYTASLSATAGEKLAPLQAGSNSYAGKHRATMIYSAKPSPQIVSILEAINIDSDIWIESVEHEAILQFMCRTSVRDPESTTSVHFTVYDKAQADYLAAYFSSLPHCEVHLSCTDLGFAKAEKNKGGRPKIEATPEKKKADAAKQAERMRAYRAKKKAAKEAA